MDKEKPSEQVLASPTLNPNSGKPTASPRETTAVSLTPNVTNARVYTRYVPGTSARIRFAGDEVAALLQKPKGHVSKEEITGQLEKLSRMDAGGEPLQGAEFLNRQSLFMAVLTRGVSEGLLTPQEVTSYRVFNQAAVGAMAMSGGGARTGAVGLGKAQQLPATTSRHIPRSGIVVMRRSKWSAPENVRDRIQKSWGDSKPNKKGVGERWQDPNDKGNGVRVDQGNPMNSQPVQQVDHVLVRSGGKVIGRDGNQIAGSIESNFEKAHIPLTDYVKWKKGTLRIEISKHER